jgi:hypothetical protein
MGFVDSIPFDTGDLRERGTTNRPVETSTIRSKQIGVTGGKYLLRKLGAQISASLLSPKKLFPVIKILTTI